MWIKPSDQLPIKPGLIAYEQIPCLVNWPGCGLCILLWNCEHECWDDESGDDYACDPLAVDCYIPISEITKAFPLP
jgi:hypothetical protein